GDLFVHLRISNVKYVNDYEYIAYAFPNVVINSDSKSVGLMNSIINWVKGIWEKLVNLPSEIGNFITNLWTNLSNFFDSLVGNLGDWFASIGDWFSDMVANLKQWFADIGDWFGSLGDRIGDFFVQIYVDITDFLSSLFLPSEDYFDNVQADLDQHMSDHLGAVYNVPKKLIWHLKDIVNGLESANGNHLVIHFPEIAFKLNGQRYSIFGGIDYDLLEPLNSLDEPATKSMINVALVLMHGFIDLGMAIAAFRMIYKQVINKVGIEGGSDL
ncbi:MAG: hypothetical protein J1E05_07320, partial [Eubacterium sp.]|nr:hypothetical protein [Eubacterium sp.]